MTEYFRDWTIGEVVTVDETDWDYDLHAFVVHWRGEAVTVVPSSLNDMQEMIDALDGGDCPLEWETGYGFTVRDEICERLGE